MAGNFTSATVSNGQDADASQYNSLRLDVLANAGDYATSTGAANAYVLAVDAQISALAVGDIFKFKANFSNTGAATINVNAIGAKAIKKNVSVALEPGDILSGQLAAIIYDGTNFQLLNPIITPIYTSGNDTKNAADASTTQNIAHGLGKIPKYIRIRAVLPFVVTSSPNVPYFFEANTVFNGTVQTSLSLYGVTTNPVSVVTTFTLGASVPASNTQTGVVTFDATNIIITWTKTNNPTGVYNILWEASA